MGKWQGSHYRYKAGDTKPPIPPHVEHWTTMELNLGAIGFMPGKYAIITQSTCTRRCTQSACVRRGFSSVFKITLRLQEMQLLNALDRATPDSPQIELLRWFKMAAFLWLSLALYLWISMIIPISNPDFHYLPPNIGVLFVPKYLWKHVWFVYICPLSGCLQSHCCI